MYLGLYSHLKMRFTSIVAGENPVGCPSGETIVHLWNLRKRKKNKLLSHSKELLATLLGSSRATARAESPDTKNARATQDASSRTASLQAPNNQVESSMFSFVERNSEKRIFYSYLYRFELTQEHLGTKVSRLLLNEVYQYSRSVSRQFGEPVASVSRNIISAAAWGTIYCLLGSSRMIEMRPDYRDIADEVELELLILYTESEMAGTIYHRIFSILDEHDLCHPEVTALIEACMTRNSKRRHLDSPASYTV